MIDISGSVEGVAETEIGLGRAGDAIRGGIREALMRSGAMIRDAARGTSAFKDRTGKLRGSIGVRLAETDRSISVTVRPSDKAGLFLEAGVVAYGTNRNKRTRVGRRLDKIDKARRAKFRAALASMGGWRIRPRPFMQPAFATVQPKVEQMIEGAVSKALGEV